MTTSLRRVLWFAGAWLVLWFVISALVNLYPDICRPPATEPWFGCLDYWAYRYQTLFGGLVALFAAGVGFRAIRAQIKATEDIEERRRGREELAARAMLTIALSEICDYTERCASVLRMLRYDGISQAELPSFPDGALPAVRAVIATSDAKEVQALVLLLYRVQIFKARYSKRIKSDALERQQCDLDTCNLLVAAERCFGFARTTLIGTDLDAGEMHYAAWRLKLPVEPQSLTEAYLRKFSERQDQDEIDLTIDETEVE